MRKIKPLKKKAIPPTTSATPTLSILKKFRKKELGSGLKLPQLAPNALEVTFYLSRGRCANYGSPSPVP
jgi:hypothetical protein